MIVAGLDFETTGLDPQKNRVIEIGAVLWDTERGAPLFIQSELVRLPEGHEVPQAITELTGIRHGDLAAFGVERERAFSRLVGLLCSAEYIVAHNAEFDRSFLHAELRAMPQASEVARCLGMRWIDTSVDVPYPAATTTRKLVHLCAEHGFVNPFAHRALFDVLSMLKLLSQYPADEVARIAAIPNVRLIANVSYDDREKAKARGYRWDGGLRVWSKQIKQHLLEQEQRDAGFPIKVMTA